MWVCARRGEEPNPDCAAGTGAKSDHENVGSLETVSIPGGHRHSPGKRNSVLTATAVKSQSEWLSLHSHRYRREEKQP